jgi:general secretion pathway protein K
VKDKGQKTVDRRQYSVPIFNQRGSAIIITVLIVTILVALVVEFAYEVYIDTAALSNWTNAQKASLIAKSGQIISSNYIKMIPGDNILSELEFPVDRDLGPNTQLIIKIEDENAKFNINNILYQGKTNDKSLSSLKKMFEYLNINPNLAIVIADWIDTNSEPTLPGSEDGAKNAPLWSVDELKLIPGINKDIFDKISPYLTIYGGDYLSYKININTAKLPVLISLDANMNESLAQKIIDYREITPFDNYEKIPGQLWNITGINIGVSVTNKSTNFRVTSKAIINEITRVIESVMNTSKKIQFWREQ